MTISLCMIVRDEERVLSRCLKSARTAFDELCVVDTGSRDRTVAIAESFGASVKTVTGCNGPDGRIRDFALARNAALDMARGDWILSLDADEVLEAGGAPLVRRRVKTAKAEGLRVTLRDGALSWRSMRLFRNDPRHRFVGRVHEHVPQLSSVGEARGVHVVHLPDKRGKEPSNERNLRLCQAEVDDHPDSTRALFYLATELQNARRFDEAILRYTQQLALGGGYATERCRASQAIAECSLLKGDLPAAVRAGLQALSVDPRYAETHCLIGDAYLAMGKPLFAWHWFKSALACGGPPPESPMMVVPLAYDRYPRARIKLCRRLLRTGKTAPAAEA